MYNCTATSGSDEKSGRNEGESCVKDCALWGRRGNMWGGWAQNKDSEKQKNYNCIDLDDFSALDKVAEQDGQSDDRHAG